MKAIVIKAALATLAILSLRAAFWLFQHGPLRDPTNALNDFLNGTGRGEDQLTDPLVLAGARVRPLLLAAARERTLSRRRYAIAHLGCVAYRPAEELVLGIIEDESEPDYLRADALEALWRLDEGRGHSAADKYRTEGNELSGMAERLLAGGPETACRTWIAALWGRHE